jgi:epsilon-lactone hydrolase
MGTEINTSRINFDKLGTQYKKANNVTVEKEIIENINCFWLFKKGTKIENRIIIYLHGGCFVLGSINSHQALVSHFADKLDIPILFIEYSLAPENPFPIAIIEILKVYQFIQLKNKKVDTIFMGDSVGAGLSMSVISILNKKSIKKPSKLIMLSPWIDLSLNNKSIIENADVDPILSKEQLEKFTALYLGNTKLSEANPIETIFEDFPPTLILLGSSEILLDDSKIAYATITEKQPNTKIKIYENQTHVWLLDYIDSEPSKNAIEEINNFINC